jgi:hypothetical protein
MELNGRLEPSVGIFPIGAHYVADGLKAEGIHDGQDLAVACLVAGIIHQRTQTFS